MLRPNPVSQDSWWSVHCGETLSRPAQHPVWTNRSVQLPGVDQQVSATQCVPSGQCKMVRTCHAPTPSVGQQVSAQCTVSPPITRSYQQVSTRWRSTFKTCSNQPSVDQQVSAREEHCQPCPTHHLVWTSTSKLWRNTLSRMPNTTDQCPVKKHFQAMPKTQ